MILIDRTETNPYFNIAAEEYVLKEFREDVFMLWINEPSVIIGKHQVAAAEADMLYTYAHDIPVIRRISGGGTVYHDTGNLNYSIIVRGTRGQLVDYKKYTGPVVRSLARKGLNATLHGKSNLMIEGMKFSGNAEHVYHDRVLHHGTLLFSTDLHVLRSCIRPDHRDYVDRSIRSNDSNITNLSEHLPAGTSMREFRDLIIEQIRAEEPDIREYSFTNADIDAIRELVQNKYSSPEWNLSWSPPYELNKEIRTKNAVYRLSIKTEKGYIRDIGIAGPDGPAMENLCRALTGKLHHPAPVIRVVEETVDWSSYGFESENQLTSALF